MQIQIFKGLWGMEDIPTLEGRLRRVREAGYDGVEINVSGGIPAGLGALLKEYDLDWVPQLIYDNAEDMVATMRACMPLAPRLFNLHSGRDKYTFDEGCRFIERILAAERDLGVQTAHETHRYRLFYSPFVTREYLRRFPEMRLNADFSHWTCVCESMLEDIDDIVELAVRQSLHIHARVGHAEGPQVSDPRAPEFTPHQRIFRGWWDRIKHSCEEQGLPALIVVPEYGPPPYLATMPGTQMPLADLWDICLWQADELRAHWNVPRR